MPDQDTRYKKLPRPESIEFFKTSMNFHKAVTSSEEIAEVRYLIKREKKSEIRVFLTNLYIVGIADVYEIIQEFPDVDCIVTMSAWNSYSEQAKMLCKDNKIGLFTYSEYYAALRYDSEEFYNYEPPKEDI
ncbi:MAG: hypothetical protein BGO68_00810 [Candidatus Amoebophilus sp. 36-38]|nr:MAG: hypothetical protein BGO68_00810 [Candidatus Amoebophilus sp. 36-38]